MKLLMISLSNFGDAFLSWPAMADVLAAFPEHEVHVVAPPRLETLYADQPWVKQVHLWDKKASRLKKFRLVRTLAQERFDVAIDFRNTLIPHLLHIPKRTPLFRKKLPAFQDATLHRSKMLKALVHTLVEPQDEQKLQLHVDEADFRWVADQVSTGGFVLMVPGARSSLKRWRAEGFAQVADTLKQQYHLQVVLIGAPDERGIAEEVVQLCEQPPINLVGQTTWPQMGALMAKAQFLVTNDTACLHAAELEGLPSVAIFGPTSSQKYGPLHPQAQVVRKALVCAPCEKAQCVYGHECLDWVQPKDVLAACEKVLAVR